MRHSRAGGNPASAGTNNPYLPRLRGDDDNSAEAEKSLFLPAQNIQTTLPASRHLLKASRMFCDLQLPNPFEIPAPFLKKFLSQLQNAAGVTGQSQLVTCFH
jgi:hypothetical protein